MINVGSVGQPTRRQFQGVLPGAGRQRLVTGAAGPVIRFRRVEYPIEKTIAKIYDIPDLDNFLGDRLRDGR